MATLLLKKGDKGENVKILQKALGVTVDGDFGPKTEEAVKLFQKKNGLCVDGLVGNETQKKLGLSFTDSSIATLTCDITKSPISKHITKHNRTIKYIVIHYTAGCSSTEGQAMKVRNGFQNSNRDASADFCVDDKSIVQTNPDVKNYYCWSVGDGKGKYGITNANSISIEMCSSLKKGCSAAWANHDGWYFTEDVLNNTVKLTKYLMAKYNIPISNVVRHYDASRKNCPGVVGWNNNKICDPNTGKATSRCNNSSEWAKFKERLKK